MSPRTLIVLGIVAAAALVLALWVAGSRRPSPDAGLQTLLAPELMERLNEVQRVRIVTAGNTVVATLAQSADGWTLQERDGYPADAAKLRELLLRIAEARRVEAKTANPDLHVRLGVEPIEQSDAYGAQVEIEGGGLPVQLIVGMNVTRGIGTYVRDAQQSQSWLIDRNIAVERSTAGWLQQDLLDIDTARIARVEVRPAQGAPVLIVRSEGRTGDFSLADLPPGREPVSEFVADATAGLLSSLRINDVHLASTVEPDPLTRRESQFVMRDGLRIDVTSWQIEGRTLAQFNASVDEQQFDAWITDAQARAAAEWTQRETAAAAPAEAGPAASEASEDGIDMTELAPAQTLAVADPTADRRQWLLVLQEEAAALNARVAARVFVLPEFKAANLNRELDAYLRAPQ